MTLPYYLYLLSRDKQADFSDSSRLAHLAADVAALLTFAQRIPQGAGFEHQPARVIGAREFPPDLAGRFVHAVLALAIGIARQARQGRERTVEQPQDFAETYGIRGPQHHIPAAL